MPELADFQPPSPAPIRATGARILSQAAKELTAMPSGSRAVVSVCADGGQGTVALLQRV